MQYKVYVWVKYFDNAFQILLNAFILLKVKSFFVTKANIKAFVGAIVTDVLLRYLVYKGTCIRAYVYVPIQDPT